LSLRFFSALALVACALLFLPVITLAIPLAQLLTPAPWVELTKAYELWYALQTTLISTLGSLVLSLVLALLIIASLILRPGFSAFVSRLPFLLAIPHLAFAVGVYVLLSPKGWLERLLNVIGLDFSDTLLVQDTYGWSLAIALGIKESWFLCWMLWAQIRRSDLADQYLVASTLGYNRAQIFCSIILPQLLPGLRWPLLAVLAYSLSSVEMAWILGPTHPPTLAVLAWRALLDPLVEQRQLGIAMAMILVVLMFMLAALIWLLPSALSLSKPRGIRWPRVPLGGVILFRFLLGLHLLLAALILIWSFTHSWFYPDLLPGRWSLRAWNSLSIQPFYNAVGLGVLSALMGVVLVSLILELNIKFTGWLLTPLFLPVLPLVISQYLWVQWLNLDPGFGTVLVAHLLWVIPYIYLVLKPAYTVLDKDLLLTGKTLGLKPAALFWRLKAPLLVRPLAAALALGFSVSLAQYLPTQFIGAGRVDTLTTETLNGFAGGDRRILGAQTLVLLMVALLFYWFAAKTPAWLYRHRRGMH